MSVRTYDELNEVEKNKLADAWLKLVEGLRIYEEVTGASDLDDLVYDELWEIIEYQCSEENEEGVA